MGYAVINIGGKQHRVREGERLVVDRVPYEAGATFTPDVLLVGGDGDTLLGDQLKGTQVTVRVSAHVLGKKVIVGKHRQRTGYRRRNGFRARLSEIQIESIGAARPARPSRKRAAKPAVEKADEQPADAVMESKE